MQWENHFSEGPYEANFLKLDCSKIKKTFGWHPTWHVEKAIEKIVQFEKANDKSNCIETQIQEFIKDCKN